MVFFLRAYLALNRSADADCARGGGEITSLQQSLSQAWFLDTQWMLESRPMVSLVRCAPAKGTLSPATIRTLLATVQLTENRNRQERDPKVAGIVPELSVCFSRSLSWQPQSSHNEMKAFLRKMWRHGWFLKSLVWGSRGVDCVLSQPCVHLDVSETISN